MEERTGQIYMGTVNADPHRRYIGLTTNYPHRKGCHLRAEDDFAFQRAIRKYGADAVSWRLLESGVPESELPARERAWIVFYDTYHNGLNETEGGDTAPTCNPEVAAIVGAKNSEIMKAKAQRGMLHTQQPEIKAKISKTMKERVARGELHLQTDEYKAFLSRLQTEKGKRGELPQQQLEARQKMSKTKSRYWARVREQEQRDAGQQFMLDLPIEEKTDG